MKAYFYQLPPEELVLIGVLIAVCFLLPVAMRSKRRSDR